eukprot:Filipodium_phascolosomae@DN2748_c2_g2_i2.p2
MTRVSKKQLGAYSGQVVTMVAKVTATDANTATLSGPQGDTTLTLVPALGALPEGAAGTGGDDGAVVEVTAKVEADLSLTQAGPIWKFKETMDLQLLDRVNAAMCQEAVFAATKAPSGPSAANDKSAAAAAPKAAAEGETAPVMAETVAAS